MAAAAPALAACVFGAEQSGAERGQRLLRHGDHGRRVGQLGRQADPDQRADHRLPPRGLHRGLRRGAAHQRAGHLGLPLQDQEEAPVLHLHGQPGPGRPALRGLGPPEDRLPPQRQRLGLRGAPVQGAGGLLLREHVLLHRLHRLHQRPALPGGGAPHGPAPRRQPAGRAGVGGGVGGRVAPDRAALPVRPAGDRHQPQRAHLPRRDPAQPEEDGGGLLPHHGDAGLRGAHGGVRGVLRAHAPGAPEQHGRPGHLQEAAQGGGADRDGAGDVRGVLRAQQRHAAGALRPAAGRGQQQLVRLLHHHSVHGQPQQLLRPLRLLLHLRGLPRAREEHLPVPEREDGGEDAGVLQRAQVLQKEQHLHVRHGDHAEQQLLASRFRLGRKFEPRAKILMDFYKDFNLLDVLCEFILGFFLVYIL